MEPKFVYHHMTGHMLVADLRRTLQELYHSKAATLSELQDPPPILHKFRVRKLRSSPGVRRQPRVRQIDPLCPACFKVKRPKVLIVASQEAREKLCDCQSLQPSPKAQTQVPIGYRLTRKQQNRGKSVSEISKVPSEKSISTYQINTTVLRLMPLQPSRLRTTGMLHPHLLDIHRISVSPKHSTSEDEPVPIDITRSAVQIAEVFPSVPELVSLKYVVYPGNNSRLIAKLMSRRATWTEGQVSEMCLHFAWHPTSRTVRFDRLVPYQSVQTVNHFEGHFELSNKLNLFLNLQRYCERRELNILEFMPLTFSIEFDSTRFHAQYTAFTSFFKALADNKKPNKDKLAVLPATHSCGQNVWILKPSGFNRGRGIYVFSSLEELKAILDEYHEAARAHPKSEKTKQTKLPSLQFVIQKYIERPFLIHSRKFDMRMWVLVTQDMQGYLYREGYLRTSSEPFTLDKDLLASQFVHLTNNAVQKTGPWYGKFELGNQLSFDYFQTYLASHSHSISLRDDLMPRIKALVKHSLMAAARKLNPLKRTICFELFGYDFILDEDLGLWLIEVNTNPCLELSSPLLAQLIPCMLDDMLKLTVDRVFPRELTSPLQVQEVVPLPEGNNWEHVASLASKCLPSNI